MKGVPIPTDELEELQAILAKAGLIKDGAALDLLPYQPAFTRRSEHRHAHYLVNSKQTAICHLVVGKNLAPLQARARDFSAACPKLACRPLLYHQGNGSSDYLCLEHFHGESLDAAVQSGRYSGADWLKAVRHAQDLLAGTEQFSDPFRLHEEVTELVNNACAFPGLSDVDARLLRDLAQPVLLDTTMNGPLVTRWSTGDFVGCNLLVDAAGDIRLIDYDHAARTHFGRSDWLRLMQFSSLPPGLDAASPEELNFPDRPRHETYLWLHQLALVREAESTETTKRHIAFIIQQLFASIERAGERKSSGRPRSFLIGSLLDGQIAAEASLQERTAWAQSLDQELGSARQNLEKLAAEHAERTAWAKSLDAELLTARAALAAQTSLVEERTAWAKSLDIELQKARSALAAQATAAESDLGKARAALAAQTSLVEERTAWAKSLEEELHSTRQNLGKLTAEYAERTAWAKSLDAELQRARTAHQEQEKTTASLILERSNLLTTIAGLEENLVTLARLRQDLAVKNAAANTAASSMREAQLRAEIAESVSASLTAALRDAQIHVDGLLQRAAHLREELTLMAAAKHKAEDQIRQGEQELALSIAELQITRAELARYANRLICRLVAGPSRTALPGKLST